MHSFLDVLFRDTCSLSLSLSLFLYPLLHLSYTIVCTALFFFLVTDPRASVPIRTGMDASTGLPVQQPPPPPQPMAHAASQPPPPYGNPPASNGGNLFAPPPPPPPSSNNPFAVGGHDAAALANAAGAENNFAPPPPPPPPPVVADKVKVVALFDFPGVEDSDLPFSEGDQFEASASEFAEQEAEGGWVKGWNRGREGVFPSNYVKRA